MPSKFILQTNMSPIFRLICGFAVGVKAFDTMMGIESPSNHHLPYQTASRISGDNIGRVRASPLFLSQNGIAGASSSKRRSATGALFASTTNVTRCDEASNDNSDENAYKQQLVNLQESSSSSSAAYTEMKLPSRVTDYKGSHAIFGNLLGEDQIESYRVFRKNDIARTQNPSLQSNDDNVIVALVQFGSSVDGHPGVVHGGIISLIFDDALGFGYEAIGVSKAVTANLSIDFRAPLPAGTAVKVSCQLDHREGRKLYWKGQMTSLDGEILFAEVSSLYIIPRSHA